MAKKKSKPIEKELHGLTPEQFAEWELMEISLEIYKKYKASQKPKAAEEVAEEVVEEVVEEVEEPEEPEEPEEDPKKKVQKVKE